MNERTVPPPTKEDLVTERLAATVESAIGVIQERLADPDNDRTAKWSVSDLVRLLQLRKELRGDRPGTVVAYWVDRRSDADQPEPCR